MDIPRLSDLDIPDDDAGVERHNKCQWAPDIKGEPLEAWKEFSLKTTNQVFQRVPEPDPYFGPGTWIRVIRKSHGGLLRPGALELIEKWQPSSTQHQRSALSELLWSFAGHLTSRRGRSETKIQYGWKEGEKAKINLIDPFASNLGRPSSAPIAHAVQLKFEKKKREEAAEQMRLAARLKAERLAKPRRNPFEKDQKDTFVSQVPFKWPGASAIVPGSSTHAQMNSVKPRDLQMAIKWGVPGFACRPPATSGMGRHLGQAGYHGDAQYSVYWPAALKTFQPLSEQRRPHDIPGHDRGKRYVV